MRPLLLHFYNAVWINLANADVHSSEMWALMPIHLYIYAHKYVYAVRRYTFECVSILALVASITIEHFVLDSAGAYWCCSRLFYWIDCCYASHVLLHLCCCSLLLFVMWQLHCAYSFVVFFFLLLLPLRSDICHIIMINTALPLLLLLQTI